MYDMDTIRRRHSVREYAGTPIEGAQLAGLEAAVAEAREGSGLGFQLVRGNPEAFEVVASFGLIHGCTDLIACPVAEKSQEEALGYWGQHIVLEAQELGLNTCWAGMFAKRKVRAELAPGERVRVVIAVGHGQHAGFDRKTKPAAELSSVECEAAPEWFLAAMEAAQLAPTALNAQNFRLTLLADGRTVRAEAKPVAFRMIDLGIVRRNFEVAADAFGADWRWEDGFPRAGTGTGSGSGRR